MAENRHVKQGADAPLEVASNTENCALLKGGMWRKVRSGRQHERAVCCAHAGQVRLMTTGASPISPEVLDFLRICFGATVLEGYGMTESACTISLTDKNDTLPGHVGGPLPCCEVKLADVPEMSYTNADKPYPRGEARALHTLTCCA